MSDLPLSVKRGLPLVFGGRARNPDGSAVDLTGARVVCQLSDRWTNERVVTFTGLVLNPTDGGQFSSILPGDKTDRLAVAVFNYDLFLVWGTATGRAPLLVKSGWVSVEERYADLLPGAGA